MRIYISFLPLLFLLSSCGESSNLSEQQVAQYTEQGKTIAQGSFKALSKQLGEALKAGGVEAAVGYCQAMALPLTDSLSKQYGAKIKRTSLKLRNPANAPDSMEYKMLKIYLQMSRMRNPVMVPKILEKNDKEIQFFAPIMLTKEVCLRCHGIEGKSMDSKDYAIIKLKYPNDEAIGYKLNQFRGMWSITLPK